MVMREFRIMSNSDEFLKSECIAEALLNHCKLRFEKKDVAFAIIECGAVTARKKPIRR